MNAVPYFLLLLAVLTGVGTHLVARQRLPLKLQRFKDRERLPVEKIRDNFYPQFQPDEFVELWREIASGVEVPPELMRPTDRFDGELGPVKGFPLASEFDDLEEAFTRRCKRRHLAPEQVKVETVDDYIKLFAIPEQEATKS